MVCEEVFVNETFSLPYDFLVMAVGTSTTTHRILDPPPRFSPSSSTQLFNLLRKCDVQARALTRSTCRASLWRTTCTSSSPCPTPAPSARVSSSASNAPPTPTSPSQSRSGRNISDRLAERERGKELGLWGGRQRSAAYMC